MQGWGIPGMSPDPSHGTATHKRKNVQREVVRLCVLHSDPREVHHAGSDRRYRGSLYLQHMFTAWAGEQQQVSTTGRLK